MSFSFRNIFSPDDSEFEISDADAIPDGFPAASSPGRGRPESEAPAPPPTQTFLASELLPYIPKAIAAQSGIPMEKEVNVPLPSDGTLDVPLSAIYRICPELFAVEITPLNDSVVTLPPRLGATPATGAAPLFAEKLLFGKPEGTKPDGSGFSEDPGKNPFWSPAASGSPDASGQEAPFGASASKKNPFSSEIPPMKGVFFPDLGGSDQAAAESSGPPAAPKSGEAGDGDPFSGFAPFGKPVPKDDAGQGFQTLFSKAADADAELPFPGKPAPSDEAKSSEKEPEGVWGAMFSGKGVEEGGSPQDPAAGFVDAPFENIGKLLSQASAPPEWGASPAPTSPATDDAIAPAGPGEPVGIPSPDPGPPSGSSQPFAQGFGGGFPPAHGGAGEPSPSQGEAAGTPWSFDVPSAPAGPGETPPPVPVGFGLPTFSEAPVAAPEPKPTAPMSQETVPPAAATAPEPPEEAAAVERTDPFPAPAVAAEPPAPVAEPFSPADREPVPLSPAFSSMVAGVPSGVCPEDERDLELRAIFSTGESFNLSKVARKVAGLPGVLSCSLSLPGKLVQASRNEEKRVGDEAREMVATLRSLAKLTGLPEARTFTLQTDRGVVSLFLEGESCVTVHHDDPAFQPGVREKLILVARSIGKLRE